MVHYDFRTWFWMWFVFTLEHSSVLLQGFPSKCWSYITKRCSNQQPINQKIEKACILIHVRWLVCRSCTSFPLPIFNCLLSCQYYHNSTTCLRTFPKWPGFDPTEGLDRSKISKFQPQPPGSASLISRQDWLALYFCEVCGQWLTLPLHLIMSHRYFKYFPNCFVTPI